MHARINGGFNTNPSKIGTKDRVTGLQLAVICIMFTYKNALSYGINDGFREDNAEYLFPPKNVAPVHPGPLLF